MYNNNAELMYAYTVRPQIEELRDIEQREFNPAVLRCLSKGDPAPQMTFRKLGMEEPYQVGRNVSTPYAGSGSL